MFEGKTEQEARADILNLVAQYCDRFHRKEQWAEGDRVAYAGRVYGREEMSNLVDSSLDFWLTAGPWTEKFEQGLARYLGTGFCSLVNSGSSANLLAFMALTSPLLKERAVQPGDEVITVAACFPTTVAPIVQYGAIPVFVDVSLPGYNIDASQLDAALSEKTKAVMLAHTLGNPFDLTAVKAFCDQHDLWLIEDNCDALGSEYVLAGVTRKTGTIGDIGTSSFYPPHHMTMGEGGAVYTSNPLLHKIMRSLRDWGRDCTCSPGQDNNCGRRFDGQFGELPFGYDHKYVYSHFGYNLKASDMQAAVGCAQLDRLPGFVSARRSNWEYLRGRLETVSDFFVLPEPTEHSRPSWFGFLLTCNNGVDRSAVLRLLESGGIQTRMLFAGNIVRHPCFDQLRGTGKYRIAGSLDATDRIMRDSFWVGVYPGMTQEMLDYMIEKIRESTRCL